jgi:hypothetical protein
MGAEGSKEKPSTAQIPTKAEVVKAKSPPNKLQSKSNQVKTSDAGPAKDSAAVKVGVKLTAPVNKVGEQEKQTKLPAKEVTLESEKNNRPDQHDIDKPLITLREPDTLEETPLVESGAASSRLRAKVSKVEFVLVEGNLPAQDSSSHEALKSPKRALAISSTDSVAFEQLEKNIERSGEPPAPPGTFTIEGELPLSFFHSNHNTQQWALRDVRARRHFF